MQTPVAHMQTLPFTAYTPLRFKPSLDIWPDYPHSRSDCRPHIFRTDAPTAGAISNTEKTRLTKRKWANMHHASSQKRWRQESPRATGGRHREASLEIANSYDRAQDIQHNLAEIDSSLESSPRTQSEACPVSSNSDTTLNQGGVYLEKCHDVDSGDSEFEDEHLGRDDYELALEQSGNTVGSTNKSFKAVDGAWNDVKENKKTNHTAFDDQSSPSNIPIRRQPLLHVPQFPPSPNAVDRIVSRSSRNYMSVPPPIPPTLDSSPSLPTQNLSSPHSCDTQSAQYKARENVPQPNAPSATMDEPEPVLHTEQQLVLDAIMKGHNVFFTGPAGCGKSLVTKIAIRQLRQQKKVVTIVAPTNLAALNINGQTIFSFAGWIPDSFKKSMKELKARAHGRQVFRRFAEIEVLLIDEISMIENHVFERLDQVMRESRGSREETRKYLPFGGVQLVITGDFFQLPPVRPFQHCIGCGWELLPIKENGKPVEYECENRKPLDQGGCSELRFRDVDKWAFKSKAWEACGFKLFSLTKIHRQRDQMFKHILQRIRTDGQIARSHRNILLRRKHKSDTNGAIKIFPTRDDVDRVNKDKIAQLPSKSVEYKCFDHFKLVHNPKNNMPLLRGYANAYEDRTLVALENHRYESIVLLKEGMRVVLQANVAPKEGLVNGSQGTIIGFEPFDHSKLPRKASYGKVLQNLDGPLLRGTYAEVAERHVICFASVNRDQPWPIVEFDNGLVRTIFADCTVNEMGNVEPYSLLSRTQIPLLAGYAITVHKSQGMTLDRVIVDLTKAWEASMIYVALSRVRTLKGLRLIGLPGMKLNGSDPQVKEFYETIRQETRDALPAL